MAKVIKVKGDASDVQTDFNHAPVGLYTAKAADVSERESSNTGQPMVEIRWEITKNGDGKKLKDSYASVFYYAPLDLTDDDMSPGWARRLKEVLVAFGLPMKGANLAKIEGKEALLRLREDTDQDGEYRPRVGKILPVGSKSDDEDAEDEEDEDAEDSEDSEEEGYTWAELQTFDRKELRTIIKEEELDIKVTSKLKDDDLRAKIAEALEIEEEDEEDDEDEVDLDSMSRAELKAYIQENELDVKVLRKDKEADIIAKIQEAEGEAEEDEEEEGDDEEEDGDNYDALSVKELKEELEARELATAGKKPQLIARLRKDDEEEPV